MTKGRSVQKNKKVFIIADAVAHTGFASVTHSLAAELIKRGYDIAILGINYYGDPHPYKYPIFPAGLGGDIYGIRRVPELMERVKPDIVLIINDPWIVKEYLPALAKSNAYKTCYTPVDGLNIRRDFAEPLNMLDHVFAYNQFGLDQLRAGGLTTSASWVPHGVDLTHFTPVPKAFARATMNISEDWFIVGCCARNQPRKRLDLAIEYFAEFARNKPDTVRFYYHGALQDHGWDIVQLCQYYGVEDRLIITSPHLTAAQGIPKDKLKFVYSAWDVQILTSNGEGFGLPVIEGMACGVPQIVPNWAALSEWPRDGVYHVPCTATEVRTGGINTIGGIPDKKEFVQALDAIYHNHDLRADLSRRALHVAHDPCFRWSNVAKHFMDVFKTV